MTAAIPTSQDEDHLNRILRSLDQHYLRSEPASINGLSHFRCSCGEIFVANDNVPSEPRSYPSMARLHQAITLTDASGQAFGHDAPVLTTIDELNSLPDWAVVRDDAGLLIRRYPGFGGGHRWLTQLGEQPTTQRIHVVLVWRP